MDGEKGVDYDGLQMMPGTLSGRSREAGDQVYARMVWTGSEGVG
jgi:hypothetical protein